MNLAIQGTTNIMLGIHGQTYRTTITIRIGAHQLHAVGDGATAVAAEQAAEQSFIAACADLDQLGAIRRRTGGVVRWGMLEDPTP